MSMHTVCGALGKLGAIKLAIFAILSLQLVAAADRYDDRDFYGDISDEDYGDRSVLEMTSSRKDHILRLHNRLRNKIANGEIGRFSSAARMPALRWNDDLARSAENKARACANGRDECRYDRYRENIARRASPERINEPALQILTSMIMDWFLEYRDADMNDIYSTSSTNRPQGFEKQNRDIDDFSVMINDRNTAVGCAMVRNQEDGFRFDYLVCNYGYANNRKPVYERGSAASRCKERSAGYDGLCRSTDNSDDKRFLTMFF